MISKRSCLILTSYFENKSSREHALSTVSTLQFRENMFGNLQNFRERLILDESSHFIWVKYAAFAGRKKKGRLSRSKLKSVFFIESVS